MDTADLYLARSPMDNMRRVTLSTWLHRPIGDKAGQSRGRSAPCRTDASPRRVRRPARSPGPTLPASGIATGLTAWVLAARAGDSEAWSVLVARFDGRLRRIARVYRLAPADVDDVVQTTWLRGFERIGQLREPTAIGSWLERILRRECLRVLQRPIRECPTGVERFPDRADEQGPEERLIALEQREMLVRAVRELPPRHQRLLILLRVNPAPSYRQISELLDMPIGSIGPIRARALARVRRRYELWAG